MREVDYEKILSAFRQTYFSLTPVKQRIASCILEMPEYFIHETITQLAARAHTSSSSVAKFAMSMGFKGYSDNMKVAIAQGIEQPKTFSVEGVEVADGAKAAMEQLIQMTETAFEDTYAAIETELDTVANLFMQTHRIEIYAAGSSLSVAYEAHYRLMRLGLPVVFLPDPAVASVSAAQMNEGDVALTISDKGRTNSTLLAAQIAKRRGAKIVALRGMANSPLANMADALLRHVSAEAMVYHKSTISRLTQTLMMDSLCAYIAAQR